MWTRTLLFTTLIVWTAVALAEEGVAVSPEDVPLKDPNHFEKMDEGVEHTSEDTFEKVEGNDQTEIREVEEGVCYRPWREEFKSSRGDSSLNNGFPWVRVDKEYENVDSSVRGPCNIPVVNYEDLTKDSFYKDYVLKSQAVLIRDGSQFDASAFSYKNLAKVLGKSSVGVGVDARYSTKQEKFSTFIKAAFKAKEDFHHHAETMMIGLNGFGGKKKYAELSKLLQSGNPKKLTTARQWKRETSRFSVGPACTGRCFDVHNQEFNILISGKRRWVFHSELEEDYFLADLAMDHVTVLGSRFHPVDFVKFHLPQALEKEGHPKGPMFECYQSAGDIMYIPPNWFRSFVNVHASVDYMLHVELSDEASMHHIMKGSDKNGDGTLSKDEVAKYLELNSNIIVSTKDFTTEKKAEAADVVFAELDTDKDGKVTVQELTDNWGMAQSVGQDKFYGDLPNIYDDLDDEDTETKAPHDEL